MFEINGLDPLALVMREKDSENIMDSILEQASKGSVLNILKSYTGYFDLFSEPIQNALDAIDKRLLIEQNFDPKIWININLKDKSIKIIDNGIGMTKEEFCYCFTPNVSFKSNDKLRGNKGVGATFLAYGYNYIKLSTKKDGNEYSGLLQNGRLWVESKKGNQPKPSFVEQDFDIEELNSEKSGTAIEIILSGAGGEKPKNLTYYGTRNAVNWYEVLRIVTPLGGIYLENNDKIKPLVVISVFDEAGENTIHQDKKCEFYYPHEISGLKAHDLDSVKEHISKFEGDPQDIKKQMKPEFKNLDCLYDILDYQGILSIKDKALFTEEEEILIREHHISCYCAHMSATSTFSKFNEELGLRADTQILRGGLLIASDTMPQGELLVIPLKRYTGYQRNTFVIVHLNNGNPDMGRKVFQPEVKSLCEKIAVEVTNRMINYRWIVKLDSGSIQPLSPSNELWEWKINQVNWRSKNPYIYKDAGSSVSFLSIPQEEQDVVALYHELIGQGIIRGINFFSSSHHDRYDALVLTNYCNEDFFNEDDNPFGVRSDIQENTESEPKVLEFKKTFDSIVDDFEKEIKFEKEIDFLVCWDVEERYKSRYQLTSLLLGKEGNVRQFYGATHQVFSASSQQSLFEVCILKDLLEFICDKDRLIAEHTTRYCY